MSNFGVKKISFKYFIKHTFIVFFILLFISMFINLVFILFGFTDLGLVTEKIKTLSPFFIVYLLVIRVFLEEWFFRGFLVYKTGILFSAFLFAAGHYGYGSIVEVVGAFILGLVLAFYYKKINNIYPLYAAHFLYNLMVILVTFFTI